MEHSNTMSETILLGSQAHARAVLDRLYYVDFPW